MNANPHLKSQPIRTLELITVLQRLLNHFLHATAEEAEI
jgi:hypothetical protein